MSTSSIQWKRPPIVEVVLGVQFDPLPALKNGHLGWFWGEMHKEFPNADDVPPIDPIVESFADDARVDFPALTLRPATGDARLRMTSADGTRTIQVQNGWLVANWTKKGETDYPGFSDVKKLFDQAMDRFSSFLKQRNLGVIRPNLWEVTYIDLIPAGTVWKTPEDLPRVLPGLFGTGRCATGTTEAIDSTWAFRLSPMPGRLRLSVQSVRTTSEPARDALLVRSVARGPLGTENADSLEDFLNFGRKAVVDTFKGLVSPEAKRYWQGD